MNEEFCDGIGLPVGFCLGTSTLKWEGVFSSIGDVTGCALWHLPDCVGFNLDLIPVEPFWRTTLLSIQPQSLTELKAKKVCTLLRQINWQRQMAYNIPLHLDRCHRYLFSNFLQLHLAISSGQKWCVFAICRIVNRGRIFVETVIQYIQNNPISSFFNTLFGQVIGTHTNYNNEPDLAISTDHSYEYMHHTTSMGACWLHRLSC